MVTYFIVSKHQLNRSSPIQKKKLPGLRQSWILLSDVNVFIYLLIDIVLAGMYVSADCKLAKQRYFPTQLLEIS